MIHHIVFDMGEVLIQWKPELLAAQAGVPEEDVPTLCRAVFGSVEWVQLDRGTVSREDALEAMCRELPERLHAGAAELAFTWSSSDESAIRVAPTEDGGCDIECIGTHSGGVVITVQAGEAEGRCRIYTFHG